MKIYSFEPIVDENCIVLILGTMPGVMSLRKQQYYGFDRNAFWRIIYALFGLEPDEDYELRRAFLLEHGIAVWDVLKACEREGSSDSDIRNPEPNDFTGLFERYPSIRYVCFNGGPASRLYERYVARQQVGCTAKEFFMLPSTSPAYTIPFKDKLEKWKLLLTLLEGQTTS
jgi:TDG/mug DNA glycosylase family protein